MDSYNLLPENEYQEIEGRRYLVPTLGVTQTNDFITNLRANQQAQNAQIANQTSNLGTTIPSNLGGLVGGTGYWTSRYQTPQTNSAVQSLRMAAQTDALNTALSNEKARLQKRYQDAYRAQQKSAYDKSVSGTSGGASGGTGIGVDVNSGENGGGVVNTNQNVSPGEYVPTSNNGGYYLSSNGNNWWQLSDLSSVDMYRVGLVPGIGSWYPQLQNPQNEQTWTNNGATYIFIKNNSFPNGRWFRARSLGTGD